MFQNLTERLSGTLKKLTGKAKLTEENIQDTLREIYKALLEADVALEVANQFLEDIKPKAIGQQVQQSLDPGQQLVKIVQSELVALMGEQNEALELKGNPPQVILMAGLQGSGKTTTSAKLAKVLLSQNKKVMTASADIYRPAAIDQLETVSSQVGATFFPSTVDQNPVDIAKAAYTAAKQQMQDVLILDTAGRLHIDDDMMQEIKAVHAAIEPVETLFVVDAMTGQDAANSAKQFHDALPLTGVILTKVDGDARGGAALSVRHITGKPIKFLGVGEKLDALEPFYPDRIASRILGMGDVLTLIEEMERKVDKKKAKKLADKVAKGKKFDLGDYRQQLQEMLKMGGMTGMLDKLPGMSSLSKVAQDKVNDKQIKRTIAIINSMTSKEQRHPDLIRGSRKRRIANGSGTTIQEVSRALKQFTQMQKMMKKMSGKGGIQKMMRGLQDRLPPGTLPPM